MPIKKQLGLFAAVMPVFLALPGYSQQTAERPSRPSMLLQAEATQELWSVIHQTADLLCEGRGSQCATLIAEEIGKWALEQNLNQALVSPIEATGSLLGMHHLIFSNAGATLAAPQRVELFSSALEDDEFTGSLFERLNTEPVADQLGLAVDEIGFDIAFSLVTGLTGEVLARHYEANGNPRAAEVTRAGFQPMVDIGVLVAGSGAMTLGGGVVSAGAIWAKNIYSFALLGYQMNQDQNAGLDIQSVLASIASQIEDLHKTLITGHLSGTRFGANEGQSLTPAIAAALQSELSDLYDLQVELMTSREAITMAAFRPVTDIAQCLMVACQGVWTGLESAQSTPGLPSDIIAPPTPDQGYPNFTLTPPQQIIQPEEEPTTAVGVQQQEAPRTTSMAPYEPQRGDPERTAILDAARSIAVDVYGAPIEFIVDMIRVADDRAYVFLLAQRPGGGTIVPQSTPIYRAGQWEWQYENYDVSGFLRNVNGAWQPYDIRVGTTEAWWVENCAGLEILMPETCG